MNIFKRFLLGCKTFFRAFTDWEGASRFLEGHKVEVPQTLENSHLRLLFLLQNQGRLIDFFKEDISKFSDAQIGAAARKIHQECGKSLEEFVTLRPLMQETEGSSVTIAQGYDTSAIKVIGKVKGNPPFQGILRHKGWRAHKLSLPKQVENGDSSVVCPAEVEIN